MSLPKLGYRVGHVAWPKVDMIDETLHRRYELSRNRRDRRRHRVHDTRRGRRERELRERRCPPTCIRCVQHEPCVGAVPMVGDASPAPGAGALALRAGSTWTSRGFIANSAAFWPIDLPTPVRGIS